MSLSASDLINTARSVNRATRNVEKIKAFGKKAKGAAPVISTVVEGVSLLTESNEEAKQATARLSNQDLYGELVSDFTTGRPDKAVSTISTQISIRILDAMTLALEEFGTTAAFATDTQHSDQEKRIFREMLKVVRESRERGESTEHLLGSFHDKLHQGVIELIEDQLSSIASAYVLPDFLASSSKYAPELAAMLALGWVGYQSIDDIMQADSLVKNMSSMLEHVAALQYQKYLRDQAAASTQQAQRIIDSPYVGEASEEQKRDIQEGSVATFSLGSYEHFSGLGLIETTDPPPGVLEEKHREEERQMFNDAQDHYINTHHEEDEHVQLITQMIAQSRTGMSHVPMRHVNWSYTTASAVVSSLAYGMEKNEQTKYLLKGHLKSMEFFEEVVKTSSGITTRIVMGGFFSVTDRSVIIIGFKGTGTTQEWITNLNFPMVQGVNSTYALKGHFANSASVHTGFHELSNEIEPAVRRMLEKVGQFPDNVDIIFTGHSLGGALATLASCNTNIRKELSQRINGHGFYNENTLPISTIVFGCPRVGDHAFAKAVEAIPNFGIQRFSSEGDPVPFLPPLSMGFAHIGVEFRINSTGLFSTIFGDGVTGRQKGKGADRSYGAATTSIVNAHSMNEYRQKIEAMRQLMGGGVEDVTSYISGVSKKIPPMSFGGKNNLATPPTSGLSDYSAVGLSKKLEHHLTDSAHKAVQDFNYSTLQNDPHFNQHNNYVATLLNNPDSINTLVNHSVQNIASHPGGERFLKTTSPRVASIAASVHLAHALVSAHNS